MKNFFISYIWQKLIKHLQTLTVNPQSTENGEKMENRNFSKEDLQMANWFRKQFSITDYQGNAKQKDNEICPIT